MTRTRTLTVKVHVDTDTDRFAVWKPGNGWVEMDSSDLFSQVRADATRATDAEVAGLRAALSDMVGLAEGGAARAHLDGAGVMQDPPHGWGRYAECEAPWCVRNQTRIASARAALAAQPADPTAEVTYWLGDDCPGGHL